MSSQPHSLVVSQCKDRIDPLHDGGEVHIIIWSDQEMKVIPHDAEILNSKGILPLRLSQNIDEQLFDNASIENHLSAVCPGAYMIIGTGHNLPVLSHMELTPSNA